MPNRIQTVLHPDLYHGRVLKAPFLEGWYCKLVDAREQHRYAIVPGDLHARAARTRRADPMQAFAFARQFSVR